MTTLPEEMKQSELIHQLVLDRHTLETVGKVEQLWMYPKQHRVLGLICQSQLLKGRKSVFKLSQVQSLGNNGILVQGQAQDTDAATVKELESLLGYELWSPKGDRLGKIFDYRFYLNNGLIRHYLWVPSRLNQLTGDVYELHADEIISVGNQRVLVSEAIAETPTAAQEGLRYQLRKVKSELKDDYSHLTQEVQSWIQQAQTIVLQTKEQAQTWVSQSTQFEGDANEVGGSEMRSRDRAPENFTANITEDSVFEDWDDPFPSKPNSDEPLPEPSRRTPNDELNPEPTAQDGHLVKISDWIGDDDALLAAIPDEDLQSDDPWI